MEDFTITNQMSVATYARVFLIGCYWKPGFILTTLFGIYYFVGLVSGYFTPMDFGNEIYFEYGLAIFIVSAPLLITLISVGQFKSNLSLSKEIKYTFGESGIRVEGSTFKGEFSWEHIIKQKEISNYIVLYHTKRTGNFIDKTKLTSAQLGFIKSKIKQQNTLKSN